MLIGQNSLYDVDHVCSRLFPCRMWEWERRPESAPLSNFLRSTSILYGGPLFFFSLLLFASLVGVGSYVDYRNLKDSHCLIVNFTAMLTFCPAHKVYCYIPAYVVNVAIPPYLLNNTPYSGAIGAMPDEEDQKYGGSRNLTFAMAAVETLHHELNEIHPCFYDIRSVSTLGIVAMFLSC